MKLSTNGLKMLEEFEGLRLDAYYDSAGVITIGYGHTNNAPSGKQYPVSPGQVITQATAELMLKADVASFEDAVTKSLTRTVTQNQFDALVSFTYNLGIGTFQSSGVLALTNSGDYQGAAEDFLKYVHANGVVNPGLVTRRQREHDLYLTNSTPGTPTPPKNPGGSTKQTDALIAWYESRRGKVTYSMTNRMGPNSYDCSSALYFALASAGYLQSGSMGATDDLFSDLEANGWSEVPSSGGSIPAKRGDVFIWGVRGGVWWGKRSYGRVLR